MPGVCHSCTFILSLQRHGRKKSLSSGREATAVSRPGPRGVPRAGVLTVVSRDPRVERPLHLVRPPRAPSPISCEPRGVPYCVTDARYLRFSTPEGAAQRRGPSSKAVHKTLKTQERHVRFITGNGCHCTVRPYDRGLCLGSRASCRGPGAARSINGRLQILESALIAISSTSYSRRAFGGTPRFGSPLLPNPSTLGRMRAGWAQARLARVGVGA